MALRATYIGINKHADPQIRDLSGAQRDALALWALFCDTIPDIQATLLTDEQATVQNIRHALDATLGAAQPEDTVIFTFSGHGTQDHRLVTHDTSVNDLISSTITMEDLASRFKETKARAVLCILDCCFSGGAPARVLENSPVPRDPGTPVQTLAGTGRILIAASNVDEPAYELPGSGHGLLTGALLEVLQKSPTSISLTSAIDEVMEIVRTEAGRLGVIQTPVLFGHVKGGLALPGLRKGQRFFAAFPELQSITIDSAVSGLSVFGFPTEVLDQWAKNFRNGLNDLQLKAVNDHKLLAGESLLVVAPTSSGKTFIGEMAAVKAILEGRKGVFLLPYRALVNEKYDLFSLLYSERLNMGVIRCTGDYLDETSAFVRGKYDLALLTYEMFLSLVVSAPSILNQIGLVVLDEAQFITDPNRGISVELLLTFLLAARERGVNPQLIALSAVIGGANNFDLWLGCQLLVTYERPVPLIEGVLDRHGQFQNRDADGQTQTSQLLPYGAIYQRRQKPSSQDLIVPLVRHLVEKGEKVIIFRNQRGAAEGAAGYLSKELGLPPATDTIASLPTSDLTSTSNSLRACLNGGIAFHNTNLSREEKVAVEQAFRDLNGPVRVLTATTTVAAGINTPATTVIIAEKEFVGEGGRPFTVAEYKNMAGRAGRLGFIEEGKAIILADNSYQREQLFQRYVVGQLEVLRSSFDSTHLDTWLVRLLSHVEKVERDQVIRLLANTYGGYLATRSNPEWHTRTKERLESLLTRMIGLDLVEQDGEYVQLTLLGRACGRSALSFESAMQLVETLRPMDPSTLTALHLIALIQVLPESDGGYTPLMKRGQSEAVRSRDASQRYGADIIRHLQRRTTDFFTYYARCKRAAILWDWVTGRPIEEIEQRYTPNPFQGRISYGDIRKFADATRFHLRSAHQIATVMFVGEGPDEEAVENLLKRLEVGLPEEALGLLTLPITLTRGEYLALFNAGMRTIHDVWSISSEKLEQYLGIVRTHELEQVRLGDPSTHFAN